MGVGGGGSAGAAPAPVSIELGSSTNPPPGSGTAVKPGITGAAVVHAAGPNENWEVHALSTSKITRIIQRMHPTLRVAYRGG